MLKRLAAVLLVGATYFAAAVAWPSPGYAQVVSSRQAVCDPQYPTRCIKPAADGSIAVTGGGGGGSGATAAASGTVAVVAGTGKPQAIDLFSSTSVLIKDGTGAVVDLSAPSGIKGVDGSTIASNANPVPVSDAGGTITVDGTVTANLGTLNGAATQAKQPALGTAGTASSDVISVQGIASMTALQVGGPVADAATASGNPVPVGGIYTSTIPTYTTGQRTQFLMGSRGSLKVSLFQDGSSTASPQFPTASADSTSNALVGMVTHTLPLLYNGTTWDRPRSITPSFGSATGVQAVEQAGSAFSYIATATTTQVKTGAGILHKIIINTPVAGTISLIDNTAGSTVNIGLITMTDDLKPYVLTYDLGFANGLRIITSVAADITVVYR